MIAPSSPPRSDPVLTPPPFCFETDTFAFANETVWNYVNGQIAAEEKKGKRLYTRRCFVMSRAAVQFWKFSRFEPTSIPLPENEFTRRIRQVTSRSVWREPLSLEHKVVFPGFRNLREASAAHTSLFQAHIGLGWPIYFRIGNFPIILPMNGRAKSRVNDEMLADLRAGFPTILWLYNFPSLNVNHCVVIYGAEQKDNRVFYRVCDPNYTDGPKMLEFDPATQRFTFQSTFYFKGGPVTARPVYRGYFE